MVYIKPINLHESFTVCYKPSLDSDKPVVETGKMVENLSDREALTVPVHVFDSLSA